MEFALAVYVAGFFLFASLPGTWSTDPDTDRYPPRWAQVVLNLLCLVFWPVTLAIGLVRRWP